MWIKAKFNLTELSGAGEGEGILVDGWEVDGEGGWEWEESFVGEKRWLESDWEEFWGISWGVRVISVGDLMKKQWKIEKILWKLENLEGNIENLGGFRRNLERRIEGKGDMESLKIWRDSKQKSTTPAKSTWSKTSDCILASTKLSEPPFCLFLTS
jgi:hypothetical protein